MKKLILLIVILLGMSINTTMVQGQASIQKSDRLKWEVMAHENGCNFIDITSNKNITVSIAENSAIITQYDGENRIESRFPENIQFKSVASNDDCFIITGYDSYLGIGLIFSSKDGFNWTKIETQIKSQIFDVFWNGKSFYGVSALKHTVLSSVDGTAWEYTSLGDFEGFSIATIGGNENKLVAAFPNLDGSTCVYTLNNGSDWEKTIINDTEINKIIWANDRFVAIGSSITETKNFMVSFVSMDGVKWTKNIIPLEGKLYDLAWNGSMFVTVGSCGWILGSQDGAVWLTQEADNCDNIRGIWWNGFKFTAVTSGGVFLSSIPADTIRVGVNNNPVAFNVSPVVEKGRTLIPLRSIFEIMNSDVNWDASTKTAVINNTDKTIKLKADSELVYINEKKVKLDVPAKIISGRIMAPLRFLAESMGLSVKWDEEDKLVSITTSDFVKPTPTAINVSLNNKITLSNGVGMAKGVGEPGKTEVYEIENDIEPDMIVVVSLSGLTLNSGEGIDDSAEIMKVFDTFKLIHIEKEVETPVWALDQGKPFSRMTYFRTFMPKGKYKIEIPFKTYDKEYILNVKVVNAASFVKQDAEGGYLDAYPEYAKTYCITNTPENINELLDNGNDGYYIQRGRINGIANIYWEHINESQKQMKYGVLIWNNEEPGIMGQNDIKVEVLARSTSSSVYASQTSSSMTDVWYDWALGKVMPMNSIGNVENNNSFVIPAGQAKWVFLNDIPWGANDVYYNSFNGVLKVRITNNTNQTLYSGNNVYCDTYLIDSTEGDDVYSEILRGVATAKKVDATVGELRGSGDAAMLLQREKRLIEVNKEKSYTVLITGDCVPYMNQNELINISNLKKDENTQEVVTDHVMENCNNYGVVYKFQFDEGFACKGDLCLKVRLDSRSNPAAALKGDGSTVASDVGSNYAIFWGDGRVSTGVLTSGNMEDTYPLEKGKQISMSIVVSGMSYMPIELSAEER